MQKSADELGIGPDTRSLHSSPYPASLHHVSVLHRKEFLNVTFAIQHQGSAMLPNC